MRDFQTFIDDVLDKLLTNSTRQIADYTFVLPSKRAGNFLKNQIKNRTKDTIFSPKILSIEDFIKAITQLKILDNTNSIFLFYQTYQKLTKKEHQESFEVFYPWAQTLIYDFNEIDRYLINTDDLFSHLSDLKEFDHWAVGEKQTQLTKNYLKFWKQLPQYYNDFTHQLIEQKEAYQGLIYREASKQIDQYLSETDSPVVFIGFNALNTAEQKIITKVLKQNRGQIFWDIDQHFIKDTKHDAGHFIRQYQTEWDFYEQHHFDWETKHYTQSKNIEIIGVPKNIGQAKQVSQILSDSKIDNAAIVVNDENLLSPILNSLPENIKTLNVTMGLSLDKTPLSSLFDLLFKIQNNNLDQKIYHKNFIDLLSHPTMARALGMSGSQLKFKIKKENHVYITRDEWADNISETHHPLLQFALTNYQESVQFVDALIQITQLLKPKDKKEFGLETEYLYHFHKVFQKLKNLLHKYNFNITIKSLQRIYKDILPTETLDFQGSPFEGYQLMGMLETRVMDYKNIILTSVNEGILPSGKSTNSFIPFTLKKKYNLPTYKEKDAIYAYHFYRLLQRAKNVYLIYNTEEAGLNAGEKSRFLTQLEIENLPQHQITPKNIVLSTDNNHTLLRSFEKTPDVLNRLHEIAKKGFSPSSLTTYIRNPLDFYKQKILGIKESDEVEETIAANTLGTVVHNVLEILFKPFEKRFVTREDIGNMYSKIESETIKEFKEVYHNANISKGKNKIIFEIAKRYVSNFLGKEKALLKDKTLRIIAVENEHFEKIIPIPELDLAAKLMGKIDRIDEVDGQIRIVDYKTGMTKPNDLKIKNWSEIREDKKFNKAFQVLCYALMVQEKTKYNEFEGGIISFKNLKEGFMPFQDQNTKSKTINKDILDTFETELILLIKEIFDPNMPFKEKEV